MRSISRLKLLAIEALEKLRHITGSSTSVLMTTVALESVLSEEEMRTAIHHVKDNSRRLKLPTDHPDVQSSLNHIAMLSPRPTR